VTAPDLPELQLTELDQAGQGGGLVLEGARVQPRSERVLVDRLDLKESELRGVTLEAARPLELRLRDVVFRDCDLSNIEGRRGGLARVAVSDSRMIGLGLAEAKLLDVAVLDSMLSLASFAFSELRDVLFERVNLREASFMEARLENVSFIDCQLEGADFRGVRLKSCVMRGSTLESVTGVESLRGLTMPWADVVSSAGALATAAGIEIESA
jgi:uncharacterized protein YjbI with pentapeptide repeats